MINKHRRILTFVLIFLLFLLFIIFGQIDKANSQQVNSAIVSIDQYNRPVYTMNITAGVDTRLALTKKPTNRPKFTMVYLQLMQSGEQIFRIHDYCPCDGAVNHFPGDTYGFIIWEYNPDENAYVLIQEVSGIVPSSYYATSTPVIKPTWTPVPTNTRTPSPTRTPTPTPRTIIHMPIILKNK